METTERVALGMVDAERKRRRNVVGAEVLEIDGLVLCFSNLPDPSINSVVVAHEPHDAEGALSLADTEFRRRGHDLGIDLQLGRHPSLDRAVRTMGLSLIIEQPGMVVDVADLETTPTPDGIRIEPVVDADGARALVRVDVEAFGGDPEITAAFHGAGAYGVDGMQAFVAWAGEDPVGIATGYEHDGAVGVMGVAVVPRARRRGLGAAITAHAARSFDGADLAWLHPTPQARTVYERIGFRRIADYEVWVTPSTMGRPSSG
jgi:GNAT superfamily N-acetyltransferase